MQNNIQQIKDELSTKMTNDPIHDSVIAHLLGRIELFERDYQDYLQRFNIIEE